MVKKKSVIKRIKTNKRNRLQNRAYKSAVKTLIKRAFSLIKDPEQNDINSISQEISLAYSKIDKAIKIGAIHKNNGARKKALLIATFKKTYSAAN
uniref:ribosomal protein S20 n=1 Tax=Glaucosphaera vacuolata TaxID=38265 RepID=UPI001FCE179B|nr:ribosomal protein S20 [Glaucosphaera vacuolata]UNJ18685.1 ribosomal protein S20 [Glaucosphaera vacuolata]